MFYGTQKFYVFFRLFYTLYERVLKAWELCQTIEENSKTSALNEEEKAKLAMDRYQAFKIMLAHVLKYGNHSEDYED